MFRFTIRDLLWLTVVVAVWFSWWVFYVKATDSPVRFALPPNPSAPAPNQPGK